MPGCRAQAHRQASDTSDGRCLGIMVWWHSTMTGATASDCTCPTGARHECARTMSQSGRSESLPAPASLLHITTAPRCSSERGKHHTIVLASGRASTCGSLGSPAKSTPQHTTAHSQHRTRSTVASVAALAAKQSHVVLSVVQYDARGGSCSLQGSGGRRALAPVRAHLHGRVRMNKLGRAVSWHSAAWRSAAWRPVAHRAWQCAATPRASSRQRADEQMSGRCGAGYVQESALGERTGGGVAVEAAGV